MRRMFGTSNGTTTEFSGFYQRPCQQRILSHECKIGTAIVWIWIVWTYINLTFCKKLVNINTMKKHLLSVALVLATINPLHAQLFSFGSGSGVPTETAMGGLLGMLIAPMVSKGQDAKLVGALLGASAMNAVGTARYNAQQNGAYAPRYQQVPVQQYANYPTASGGAYSSYDPNMVPLGMIQNNGMVKSPYSNFSLDKRSNGITSGQVIFDPFTGQSFRIP